MKENKVCRVCSEPLILGENITQYRMDHSQYVCRNCETTRINNLNHRVGRCQPMSENRECGAFLGVHIAEQVLASVFKNVQRMPYNNSGYDFKCNNGYLVDVKSSCRHHHLHTADNWVFRIRKNPIAQYFLCLAFDNRDDLNPEHVWLIPASDINNKTGVGISETTLDKWQKYEQPIDRVMACCNTMKT